MKSRIEFLLYTYNKPTFPVSEGWKLKYYFSLPFPPTTGNNQYYTNLRLNNFNGSNFAYKNKSVAIGYKNCPNYSRKKQKPYKAIHVLKDCIRDYRQYAKYYLANLVSKRGTISKTAGACILIVMPDRRRRDMENLLKVVNDALQYAKIVEDDKLFRRSKIIIADEPDKIDPNISFLIFERVER